MPSLFRTFGLALLMATASGALVNPTPHPDVPAGISARDTTGGALNPMKGGTRPLEYAMTNGQRLARGLPPNKPHHRRQGRSPVLSQAKYILYSKRAQADRKPRPSSVPQPPGGGCKPRNGVVHVTSPGGQAGGRTQLDGYLSSPANEFGEYGYTTDRAQALKVTIDNCNGSPFDLLSTVSTRTEGTSTTVTNNDISIERLQGLPLRRWDQGIFVGIA